MGPYREGVDAYQAGKDYTENPYASDQWQRDAWWEGWDDAQEEAYNEGR